MIVGGSSGGVAVLQWINYIKEKVKKGKVWGFSDSGVFLDSINIKTKQSSFKKSFMNLMVIVNTEINLPLQQCVKKYPTQIQMCMFAQNLFPLLKVPVFFSQSQYDAWSLPHILGVTCLQNISLQNCTNEEITYIQEYHKNMTFLLISMGSINQNGIWAPVCALHGFNMYEYYYSEQYRVPEQSQNSLCFCLDNWINNPQKRNNKFIDLGKWPQNKPCSGMSRSIERQREKIE